MLVFTTSLYVLVSLFPVADWNLFSMASRRARMLFSVAAISCVCYHCVIKQCMMKKLTFLYYRLIYNIDLYYRLKISTYNADL